MATMVDLLHAAQAERLPLEVTPDFTTNGHNGVHVLSPDLGYLHHTAAKALGSVYRAPPGSAGWDTSEWRPEVPSPRCQVYAARARSGGCRSGCPYKGKAHLVFVSAGVAYQAGKANRSRIEAARAGRINAGVPNAAAAGLPDDYGDANDESMGIEIDWAVGEDWPADLRDIVCRIMDLAVRVFGWTGVGCWIRHRQATNRKPDPDTDYDFWTGAAGSGGPANLLEELMALDAGEVDQLAQAIAVKVGGQVNTILTNFLPRMVMGEDGRGNSYFSGDFVAQTPGKMLSNQDEQTQLQSTLAAQGESALRVLGLILEALTTEQSSAPAGS